MQSILRAVWSQTYDPIGQPWLSTLCAALPVVALLGSLAFLKLHAHVAALVGLVTSLVVAILLFGMPAPMALASAGYGAAYGLLPIGWIVLNVIFLYQLTEQRGLFATLRQSITHVTTDARLQLLLVAFAFGAFFEGAAGFGTPVAVTGALLIGLGFAPLAASGLSLIANTAPVAFGALGTPIIALSAVSGLDLLALSGMVGRQLPLFSVIVPFWLIAAFAGWRGMVGIWPAILAAGAAVRGAAGAGVQPARARGWWTSSRPSRRWDRWSCSCASGIPATAGSRAIASACGRTTARRRRRAAEVGPRVGAVGHPQRARLRLGVAAGEDGARRMDDRAHSRARPAQPHRAGAAGRGDGGEGTGAVCRLVDVGHRHGHPHRRDPRGTGDGLLGRANWRGHTCARCGWCARRWSPSP